MSVSSEVRRTLVKSPPELWAELSDPSTLARHLGELGEIRIVRTEPDRAVDWEAAADDGAHTSGRVEIEASGWGTRVTLSASRTVTVPESEPAVPEPVVPAPDVPEVEAIEAETPAFEVPETAALEPGMDAPEGVKPEPEPFEPEPRRGFFARLFRRRREASSAPDLQPEPEPEIGPEGPCDAESPAAVEFEQPTPEQAIPAAEIEPPEPDISAELAELEQQTTAVLTGVLDRLGAAHHRPFSRA